MEDVEKWNLCSQKASKKGKCDWGKEKTVFIFVRSLTKAREEEDEEEEDRDDEGKTTARAVKRTLWEKND